MANKLYTLNDLRKRNFTEIGLQGAFLEVIGKACLPTSIMLYGKGGSGKSTMSLILAQHLDKLGYQLHYVAKEQLDSPTFITLLDKNNINLSDNVVFSNSISDYALQQFIFIDSKDACGFELKDYLAFRKKYPHASVIITSQGTKAGDFTGKGQWRNEIDTLLYCEKGIVYGNQDKNRWGGSGRIRLW